MYISGCFLIPYFLPGRGRSPGFLVLEIALGQHTSQGAITAWFKDVCAHCYSASLVRTQITRHAMHRARVLSNKMNNDRVDGHCYSFARI